MTAGNSYRTRSILAGAAGFIALTVFDQITKHLAALHLPGKPVRLLPGILHLEYVENRGAAFGILQGKQLLFLVISIVILAAVCCIYVRLPFVKRFRPARLMLVMLSAGAAGNMIDRAVLRYVRDFIYFVPIDFPVFNAADVYVVAAAAGLCLLMLLYYRDEDFPSLRGGRS